MTYTAKLVLPFSFFGFGNVAIQRDVFSWCRWRCVESLIRVWLMECLIRAGLCPPPIRNPDGVFLEIDWSGLMLSCVPLPPEPCFTQNLPTDPHSQCLLCLMQHLAWRQQSVTAHSTHTRVFFMAWYHFWLYLGLRQERKRRSVKRFWPELLRQCEFWWMWF